MSINNALKDKPDFYKIVSALDMLEEEGVFLIQFDTKFNSAANTTTEFTLRADGSDKYMYAIKHSKMGRKNKYDSANTWAFKS